jgi:hypothetical protein
MEYLRIIFICFSVYAVAYCLYAVKVVLVHREVQLMKSEQIESDFNQLNRLYLSLAAKCSEDSLKNISFDQMIKEVRRLIEESKLKEQ